MLVEFDTDSLGDTSSWDYLLATMTELCQGYSGDQLRTIVGFITESTEITQRSTAHLTEEASS